MILPSAETVQIKEQIINDLATGLVLIFTVVPNGESRLHMMGDNLPFGNRDFAFDKEGGLVGTGTGLTCSPWHNLITPRQSAP